MNRYLSRSPCSTSQTSRKHIVPTCCPDDGPGKAIFNPFATFYQKGTWACTSASNLGLDLKLLPLRWPGGLGRHLQSPAWGCAEGEWSVWEAGADAGCRQPLDRGTGGRALPKTVFGRMNSERLEWRALSLEEVLFVLFVTRLEDEHLRADPMFGHHWTSRLHWQAEALCLEMPAELAV